MKFLRTLSRHCLVPSAELLSTLVVSQVLEHLTQEEEINAEWTKNAFPLCWSSSSRKPDFCESGFPPPLCLLDNESRNPNIYRAPPGSRYTIYGEQVLSSSSYVRWKGKAPLYSTVFVSCFTNFQLWVRERASILRTGRIAHRASYGSQEGIISFKAKAWDQLSLLYIFLIYILTIAKALHIYWFNSEPIRAVQLFLFDKPSRDVCV